MKIKRKMEKTGDEERRPIFCPNNHHLPCTDKKNVGNSWRYSTIFFRLREIPKSALWSRFWMQNNYANLPGCVEHERCLPIFSVEIRYFVKKKKNTPETSNISRKITKFSLGIPEGLRKKNSTDASWKNRNFSISVSSGCLERLSAGLLVAVR